MAVHVFPVESLCENDKALSIKKACSMVRACLSLHNQLGETTDAYMHCANPAALSDAVDKFVAWSEKRPQDDPKLLWLSLHSETPKNGRHVGTRGISSEREIVDWWKAFSGVCGRSPRNVVVLMDVCWGASPAAPSRLTKRTGNPSLLFGPVRSATRVELDFATGHVVSALARGTVPAVRDAKRVVDTLNTMFPSDPKNGSPFYRVFWWSKRSARPNCHPAFQGTRLTRVRP
jgi:hypothetical protein